MNAVLEALREAVTRAGSQKALGLELGVSGPFISMMINGHRKVPSHILEALGFERVVIERKRNEAHARR